MDEKQLRLECLRVAAERTPIGELPKAEEIVIRAEKFVEFCTRTTPTGRKKQSSSR